MNQNTSCPTRFTQFIELTLATWLSILIGIIIFTIIQTIELDSYQTRGLWQQFHMDLAIHSQERNSE